MCKRFVHFICAESGSLNGQVLKIMKNKSSLHYICKKCAPVAIKSRLVPEDISEIIVEGEIKSLKQHIKKVETEFISATKNIERLQQKKYSTFIGNHQS